MRGEWCIITQTRSSVLLAMRVDARMYMADWQNRRYRSGDFHFGAARSAWMPSSMKCSGQEPRSRGFMRARALKCSRTTLDLARISRLARRYRTHPGSAKSLARGAGRRGSARQSDDPRARTPTDLNCKLISLLCSQPPSAYHLSPIRDAVARHASHRSQL